MNKVSRAKVSGMQKAADGFLSAVGDKIKSAGKWIYNTVPTGRYLLSFLNSRNMAKLTDKLMGLINSRQEQIYGATQLRSKAMQAGDKARVAQLDEQLRDLNIRQQEAWKLHDRFDKRWQGEQWKLLTATRHLPLASPIHTLANFLGIDTGARDIMDPRNYEQLKNLPPDIKKQLELQVSHAGVTDVADTVLLSALGMGAAAKVGTKLAPYVAHGLGRVGIPAAAAPAVSTAGVMTVGLGARSTTQNIFAELQRRAKASYGNPNALLAGIPGFAFANYAGFGQLMDIQNGRMAETIQALNTPGSLIKQRFNTQQDAKVPYINGPTVLTGILPAAFVSGVPWLNAVDQGANIFQYSALGASPALRKYIQGWTDPTAALHLYLSGGRHNSSITNDLNEILAEKYGIIDPHNFMWPGQLHQATLNKLLFTHPDVGYRLANHMVTSHLNKMALPKLPAAASLWHPGTGKPLSPVAQRQLISVADALIEDKGNTFGAMRIDPTAPRAQLLQQLKLNWKQQLLAFIYGAPEQRRLLALQHINSKLRQKYDADLIKYSLLQQLIKRRRQLLGLPDDGQ